MATVVFCNVGTTDVRVDGEFPEEPPRAAGEALLQQSDLDGERLTFPVIQPALEYVLRQTQKIARLVFIGTDQQHEHYRQFDTLHFARLAADVLAARYSEQIEATAVACVGLEPPIDPSLYDEAFSAYDQILRQNIEGEYDACYVLPTGGLPACNTALILQGIGIFAERCHVVYCSENGEPWPLQIGHQITRVMRNAAAIELLNQFDFAAASRLLAWDNHVDEVSMALIAYASARLDFDFDGARDALETAISKSTGDLRQMLHAPRQELDKLLAEEELARIGEMYHNARIAWDNGRYVAYLGRLIRFQEAVLRYLVTNYFQEAGSQMQEAFSSLAIRPDLRHLLISLLERQAAHEPPRADLYANAETLQRLRENMVEYFNVSELRDLCFDLAIDYESLPGEAKPDKVRELIDYTRRTDHLVELVEALRLRRPQAQWGEEVETAVANPGNLRAACAALRRIDHLVPLRNTSIVGHGFRGVSADIILEEYNADPEVDVSFHPVQDMAIICGVIDIPLVNPFRDIRDVIIRRLR